MEERSQIERLLSLRRFASRGSLIECFSNQAPLECPPWARGAYGGQLIAQSLLAAYETVPDCFVAHSIRCDFLAAAKVEQSIKYYVERLRDGKSFATRCVQVKQGDNAAVSAIVNFTRETKDCYKINTLQHETPIPVNERPPPDDVEVTAQSTAGQGGPGRPCDCVRSVSKITGKPNERKFRQWVRSRERIQDRPLAAGRDIGEACGNNTQAKPNLRDNHHTHLAALAYMSDNYVIGTVFRAHNASRFSNRSHPYPIPSKAQQNFTDGDQMEAYLEALAQEEDNDNIGAQATGKHVKMMVTLSHTIFFHRPRGFRADRWLLAEMESPWADSERGLVVERLWCEDGTLVATCFQEGVVRLSQNEGESKL